MHSIDRLTSSSHSLQAIFSLAPPTTTTTSYPHIEEYISKIPPNSAQPTKKHKTPSTYASLCHLNHLNAHAQIGTHDDKINKSSDEHTESTYLSNVSPTISNDKHAPVEIRVRCIFLRVGEIDTLNERYTSEIFFEASWYIRDPKIEFKYDPQIGHFNPQLVVLNHIGDSL
jgi:hypothetical protein